MSRQAKAIEQTNVINLVPNNGLSVINSLPDLSLAIESPLDIAGTYWTPTAIGEYKRGVILSVQSSIYPRVDENTGEITDLNLLCVVMGVQNPDLSLEKVSNGSKRLVAIIQRSIDNQDIIPGITPVQIKYQGKIKNSTNSYVSDAWSIKILTLPN